jgi:maltooligosyltrehalose trehalohydrolase
MQRRYPIGAEIISGGKVHFRVWAPKRKRVEVILDDGHSHPLQAEGKGYFVGTAPGGAGTMYRYRLDGGSYLYPDPASRFQPQGPHGPSQVVDPTAFKWQDGHWPGCNLEGGAIYELHIGTFTREGTWRAAHEHLPGLAKLGVTVLEVMPVAEFSGRFGWGYDGVALFAPTLLYGAPDDFRRFVDAAHAAGLGVILDVVYNHFGPDGNYLREFSADYFTDRYDNEWGEAINFDGDNSGPVREFFLTNAAYWIDEYHLDGLRLDATQQMFDHSPEHILKGVMRAAREAARGRSIFVVAENEAQDARLARPVERQGFGLSAVWNDDFHHSARVALTGRHQAYYTDFRGTPQEFVTAVKHGFLYQGQWFSWQKKRRGTPALDLPAKAFVTFLENHDQVANSARGWRLHQWASPGKLRAMTALLLLGPNTPMLFQGQEFASSAPFLFFADHKADLAQAVAEGRKKFLTQFPGVSTPEIQEILAMPHDAATFQRCKLDWSEREKNAPCYALHGDLLRLRREDPVFRERGPQGVDGAVLSADALVLRFFGGENGDRLLLINLGRDLILDIVPEPLLAPPEGAKWDVVWSSEDPRYGGHGVPVDKDDAWKVPSETAAVLRPA